MLKPIVLLMRRIRLLPKFLLVSSSFLIPLLLTTSLLFAELVKSIDTAKEERAGIQIVQKLQTVARHFQQHRSLSHMRLSGNGNMDVKINDSAQAIDTAMSALAVEMAANPHGTLAAWQEIEGKWKDLQSQARNMKPHASHLEHDQLVRQLDRIQSRIADGTGLSIDPDVTGNRLAYAMLNSYPSLAENFSQLAGRGAAYIDTGLLAPSEDILLHNIVSLSRRDLVNIKAQLDSLVEHSPALKPMLDEAFPAMPEALAYLERAHNEVLNSYQQGSGQSFQEAGSKSVMAMHDSAAIAGKALDTMLEQRITRLRQHLYLILVIVMVALGAAAYLLAGFYMSFSIEVGKLKHAVACVAHGDLGSRIHSQATDEIGQLVNAFDLMKADLARLVSDVRASSEAVTETSRQITSDNRELAARTETQASSLQQTASSMEELATTVRQNASTAVEAHQLVVAAAETARRGGQAVQSVTVTMSDIRDSSTRIMDIIHVIDSIAFQTNILALNAAVEAARAGEQGRGFAVVASEVRALAQRSANAAREIKMLIEHSAEEIASGTLIANQAGAAMPDIVRSVQQVAELMNSIASASREQSTGIEEVNKAVGKMDQLTQHNAALVEHASAAADALLSQATSLEQAVSVFKLEA